MRASLLSWFLLEGWSCSSGSSFTAGTVAAATVHICFVCLGCGDAKL